jgi:hypothetical protein
MVVLALEPFPLFPGRLLDTRSSSRYWATCLKALRGEEQERLFLVVIDVGEK